MRIDMSNGIVPSHTYDGTEGMGKMKSELWVSEWVSEYESGSRSGRGWNIRKGIQKLVPFCGLYTSAWA